jgi:hypothetical protein
MRAKDWGLSNGALVARSSNSRETQELSVAIDRPDLLVSGLPNWQF